MRRYLLFVVLTALAAVPFVIYQTGQLDAQSVPHPTPVTARMIVAPKSSAPVKDIASPTRPTATISSIPNPAPPPVPTPAPTPPPIASSDHDGLMAAAGIAANDYPYANYIITVESSWNPYAVEPASGACGLMQELPCGKSGCSLGDEVCELRWGTSYVLGRYGSWYAGYSFHVSHGWY